MPLSPAAAARYAGVSRPTISRAVQSGELNATRRNDNRRITILEEDLDTWMERRVVNARAPDPTSGIHGEGEDHEDLRGELELVKAQLLEARVEAARAQGRVDGLEGELRTARELNDELRASRDEYRRRMLDLEGDQAGLRQEVEDARGQVRKAAAAVQEARKERDAAKQRERALEARGLWARILNARGA